MGSNNRKQLVGSYAGPAVLAALCILFIGGAALGFLWQKQEVYTLSRTRKQREVRVDELSRQNEGLRRALASLSSPRELDLRVRKMNLGLIVPLADQIIRLPDGAAPSQRTSQLLIAGKPAD